MDLEDPNVVSDSSDCFSIKDFELLNKVGMGPLHVCDFEPGFVS